MRKLKKIIGFTAVILVVLAIGILLFLNTLKPTYKGEKTLKNVSQAVTVFYDTYGIPHIYGKTESDAFRALGYVHAQDRLWQMELLRRVGRGGLSEVFGEELLPTDKFFIALGIIDASKAAVTELKKDQQMMILTEAYLDGINQFIAEGPTPPEYYLTGLKKNPFVLEDVYNAIGYMAFSFAAAHRTDPLLTNIRNKLGEEYLEDLAIAVDPTTKRISNYNETDSVESSLTTTVLSALNELSIPQFIGSNAWVIGPEKTKSGKVLFANDPHIGFAQPSVWYEAHISTPTYEKYGYHLAGIPFPMLAHDRNIAYGLTMFENDDIDFYAEEPHPTDSTKYKTELGWNTYEHVNTEIKVKGASPVFFGYRKTRNGPVLNEIASQVEGEIPISMSWIYTQRSNKLLEAFYGMSHAKNISEFRSALPNIHAPGLNVMYGDSEGNIAWWAAGALYQMPDSLDTKFVLNGNSGAEKPLRYLNFTENPQAENPPWNYVYSANNQPDSVNGNWYPGYYFPENRAKRIQELLEEKNDWDSDAASAMITDVTSAVDPSILMDLGKSLDVSKLNDGEIKLLDRLNSWKGNYTLEDTNGAIYQRWIYYFIKNTFADELGEEWFRQFLGTNVLKRTLAPMAKRKASVWWDNVHTDTIVENQDMIVLKSFKEALTSLKTDFGADTSQWTWNKLHTLEHTHPIGDGVGSLRSFFNVGPFPVPGSKEVINNFGFNYTEEKTYKVTAGPSTRRIIDFSDIEHSISILPTGQSGNPFSPHYKDQATMFVNGEFRKMLLNTAEIQSDSSTVLRFLPEKK